MAKTSTYLNFSRETEEVFQFYKSVFGGEFCGEGILRFGDIPPMNETQPIADEDKDLIMHVELEITGGHILMGSDTPESMGFKVVVGNNVHLNLETDTRKETKSLFDALSENGKIVTEPQEVLWGAYYGSCTDKYGIQWMLYCQNKD